MVERLITCRVDGREQAKVGNGPKKNAVRPQENQGDAFWVLIDPVGNRVECLPAHSDPGAETGSYVMVKRKRSG